MKIIEVKLYNDGGREIFTENDRFEIHAVNSFMYMVVGINGSGRHNTEFFGGMGPAKDKIRQYYERLGITEEKVKATSPWWEQAKYVSLKPKYSLDGY